jgi:hypothetical protein
MGRGRQKAKQTKIARKLKYLTTDTDYDELAKELSSQEASDEQESSTVGDEFGQVESVSSQEGTDNSIPGADDDLDDYAKWAAQAAAKATASEIPSAPVARRRHIPIPVPSALKPKLEKHKVNSTVNDSVASSEDSSIKSKPARAAAGAARLDNPDPGVNAAQKVTVKKTAAAKKPATKKTTTRKPAAKTAAKSSTTSSAKTTVKAKARSTAKSAASKTATPKKTAVSSSTRSSAAKKTAPRRKTTTEKDAD